MKCTEVEKQIDSLFNDEIRLEVSKDVRQHLRGCKSCEQKYERLNAINRVLLKTIPVPEPKRIDAQVMNAFRLHHNRIEETKEPISWWAALTGIGVIPRTALAGFAVLFVVSVAMAFQLGRITATNQIALSQPENNSQPALIVNDAPANSSELTSNLANADSSKSSAAPVVKYIKVPVVRERVVNRIVYLKATPKTVEESLYTSTIPKRNNPSLISSMKKNEFQTETNLRGFQLVSDSKPKVIKKGETNEN